MTPEVEQSKQPAAASYDGSLISDEVRRCRITHILSWVRAIEAWVESVDVGKHKDNGI